MPTCFPDGFQRAQIDFSQDEIATLANVARTAVGRVVRRLEKAGHIQQRYRKIRLLAPDSLRAMPRDRSPPSAGNAFGRLKIVDPFR
jgi:hypothetical protein